MSPGICILQVFDFHVVNDETRHCYYFPYRKIGICRFNHLSEFVKFAEMCACSFVKYMGLWCNFWIGLTRTIYNPWMMGWTYLFCQNPGFQQLWTEPESPQHGMWSQRPPVWLPELHWQCGDLHSWHEACLQRKWWKVPCKQSKWKLIVKDLSCLRWTYFNARSIIYLSKIVQLYMYMYLL